MPFPIFDFLAKRADLGPDRTAMQDLLSGDSVSYRQLHERSGRSAALLQSLGIRPGDRVALLCRNRIEFFELLFCCARLGAILVPLNWRMPATELTPLLADCAASLLIHGREDAPVAALLARHDLPLLDLDASDNNGFRARRDDQQPLRGLDAHPADDCWYLLYTSGTSGKPKAVIQTFGMALANYVNISQAMGLRADDTTLNYLPLFHTGGINLTTLPALIMGARVLITPGFDLQRTIDLLESGQLSNFFGVPAIYQAISLHPGFDQLDLRRVRCWGCGGAPMPIRLLERFAAHGAIVLNGMGMTETGPTLFLMDAANAQRKIGSVGKPQLLCAARLVGANGQDVQPGETGELWFAGPGITPGYYHDPVATRQLFADGRWLRSGDLAQQDDEGYYTIVGRLKDMFISGGENVYPAEIEGRLAQHPAILEVAVTGIADEQWGEVGCAYLLLQPDHATPDVAQLRHYCRQYLAAYKVPRDFMVVSDFPRTAAGKIQKHRLAEISARRMGD